MYRIVSKEILSPSPRVVKMRVLAPEIARMRKPGQFVALRAHEYGERFPLTIVDSDSQEESITIIFQEVGVSTQTLGQLEAGDSIRDVAGPLGRPTDIEPYGNCVCVGGGIGVAPLYPIAKGLKALGNTVRTIIGARNEGLLILEDDMRSVSDELFVATDDGSRGTKGFVSDVLQRLIDEGRKIDLVVAIGAVPMMKAVSNVSRKPGIHTIVSLNPIMVDGTGMCGGCRVLVGGETRFACVDGPEFDGHLVDFDALSSRLRMYNHLKECASGAFAPAVERKP